MSRKTLDPQAFDRRPRRGRAARRACGEDDDVADAPVDETPTTSTDDTSARDSCDRRRLDRRHRDPTAPRPTAPRQRHRQSTAGKPEVEIPAEPPTELIVTDLIPGDGPVAEVGDTVTVNYVGVRSEDGLEFDNSYDRGQPFPVVLGTGSVIRGWDEGLIGAREGARIQLDIPPDLAYGDQARSDVIRANEALTFVVDVVSVESATRDHGTADGRRGRLPRHRRLRTEAAGVHRDAAVLHRRHQDVHGRGRDQLRSEFTIELDSRSGPAERQQLRHARPLPLLRRHRVPPGAHRLRGAVRRPRRQRLRRAGLHDPRRVAAARRVPARLDRDGEHRPAELGRQPVLHHHRRQRCRPARRSTACSAR